jgi:hypothetical protein
MALRFETEELDDATVQYLRTVRELEGEGMPGIYLDAGAAGLTTDWVFGCGAACGLGVLFLTLIVTWASLSDPVNTAMLQTAGFLLGGWLILAWFRVLIGKQRSDYVGHFKFIDPLYVWHAAGRGVWVTPLEGLRSASVEHCYNNEGNYTSSLVVIRVGEGQERLALKSMARAEQVAAYLESVAEMRDRSPIDRGYRAKGIADLDEDEMRDRVEALITRGMLPDEGPRGRRRADERREVNAIPEPHKVRTDILGWWPYPTLLAGGLVLFFMFKGLAGVTRDQASYDEVKDRRPPELRSYLVDPRNTRYRAEVQKKLDKYHEEAALRIRRLPGGGPEVKAGLADIVDALKKTTTPVILIGFKGKAQARPGEEGAFRADALKKSQKDASKSLAQLLLPVVGEDLALYADAEEGASPHIEIGYDIQPVVEAGGGNYRARWTVTLRGDPPGGKAHVFQTDKTSSRFPGAVALKDLHTQLVNDLKTQLSTTGNPFLPGPGMPRK